MPIRVLTTAELNRAVLARQLLLQRSPLSPARALAAVGGLQTQYAPSGYVGLWSRLQNFERGELTTALVRRSVVQGTLMRSTIHMVAASDYRPFAAGIRRARREWWSRIARGRGLDGHSYEAIARVVRDRLAAGPQPRAELVAEIVAAGYPKEAWEGVAGWVDMVRVPPSGTWERRRADLYALADSWLAPQPSSEAEGLVHLIRSYLRGFGPAAAADVASWSGVPVATVTEAAERLELRRFRDIEERELFDVTRAPLPDPAILAPVRFLPTWDATLLVHARRTGILAEEMRPYVFSTKNPHSVGTVLVDGTVAATWKLEGSRVVTTELLPMSAAARRAVRSEADQLSAFHAD